ncbi:MAG TPA: LysR family transcriptional regulator [Deltaproteobacteria bacterium]|nr:LysR family transcriptional regulator [Deltaproteobacteria bacterium]
MDYNQFRHITMQQLDALVCLVEERSFSGAAKKMLLSQPSLSKHIKNLEIFVNCRLIDRTRNGISLTNEGAILYGYAKKILKLRDEARDKIVSLKDSATGHVFIGASTIPSTYILPRVLTGIRQKHPDINVHILSSDSDDILEMVLSGQVEIGFIGKATADKRLRCEPIWHDELILAAKRGNPLENIKTVTVDDIAQEQFILREKGSATRSILEEYLRTNNLPGTNRFNIACEMGSSEAVKEAVISGLGVSILSVHAVRRELEQGIISRIPIQGHTIKRSFFIIYKKPFSLRPHHRSFIRYAKTFDVDAVQ